MFVSPTTPQIQAERRTRQFVRQWFQLIEGPKTNPERFRTLLSQQELFLGFRGPGATIRSFPEFSNWLRQKSLRLHRSQHRLENMQITDLGEGRITARIDLAWEGMNPAGIQTGGKLRHEWELLETNERYLRLERARVTMLEPIEVRAE